MQESKELFEHPLEKRPLDWLVTESAVLRAVNRDPFLAVDHYDLNVRKIKAIESEMRRRIRS